MAKTTDFGGLPSVTFTKMLATFRATSGPISDPLDRVKVLAMLANEEHAAANSVDFNLIDVVTLSIKIDQLHSVFTGGGTIPSTAVNDMVDLLDNLRQAWKP